jgi:TPR repeat protein
MGRLDRRSKTAREHAADKGQVEAQFDMGLMYSTGHGVEQDYVAAHKWFNLAAAQGNQEARTHRADLARDMSAAEIAQAQKLAREWMHSR